MTPDERQQLHEQAAQLSYQALVYDGLGREPLCDDDLFAEEMAAQTLRFMRGLLDEEWNRIEIEKEREIVAHD